MKAGGLLVFGYTMKYLIMTKIVTFTKSNNEENHAYAQQVAETDPQFNAMRKQYVREKLLEIYEHHDKEMDQLREMQNELRK